MIGREKSRHCQTWLARRSSLNKTYSESRIELQNLQILKKSGFVIGAALSAEKLGRCLENYRSWKNALGKLVVTVNLEAIWFELNERSVNDVGDFCLLWLVILKSETHFSCDTVDRGLWLAILSSLLCTETDRNIVIIRCVMLYNLAAHAFSRDPLPLV